MAGTVRRKNYRIDVVRLERARRALGTRTETETIHRALDLVADEAALARALRALIVKGRGQAASPARRPGSEQATSSAAFARGNPISDHGSPTSGTTC